MTEPRSGDAGQAGKPRLEAGFSLCIGLMFLVLAVFVVATWTVEVSDLGAMRQRVTAISGASLPELVDTQKILLSIENLRRFAEVAYVSRTPKSRREARLSAREIVAETVFLSSEALHEDALRVSRIIDAIVRSRTGIEKEMEIIAASSVAYLQAVEHIAPRLRTAAERQAAFGLFLDFFLAPREDFSTRPPQEVAIAFQRHIRDMQIVADAISPGLSPALSAEMASAMRSLDSSLHAIAESSRVMDAANAELNENWVEIDQLLKGMRDRARLGGESAVEGALGAIGDVADAALRSANVLFAVLMVLIALDFALLYAFVTKPLKWTSRKLMEIQEGVLDTPAPVIRVREVALLARLLDRFAGRLGDLYRQSGELEEAAAAKNDLEEVMRAVFMASLDGYVVWRGGRVELVSPMTLKLLGVDAREEFSRRPERFGFSRDRLRELARTAAFEKSVREEVRLEGRGGLSVPAELTHLPVRFRGRDCLLTYIRDLRRQKRSEEALRLAKLQAEAGAKAKSEFLANMSHEIMTPLSAILGLTRMTLAGNLEPPQQERLAKVEGEARKLVSVMHDILDFSAMDSGHIDREVSDFSVARVMKAVIDSRAPDAEAKGVTLAMKIPTGLPPRLSGDAGLLAKVLDRLTDNAVKFTDRGRVTLEACELAPGFGTGRGASVSGTGESGAGELVAGGSGEGLPGPAEPGLAQSGAGESGAGGLGQGLPGAGESWARGFGQGPTGTGESGANGFGQGRSGPGESEADWFGKGRPGAGEHGAEGLLSGGSEAEEPGAGRFGQGEPGTEGSGSGLLFPVMPGAVRPGRWSMGSAGSGTVTVLFTVRDTGIGIPPGREEGLFSVFSQADGSAARRHGGTGLGLSFAKKAVEMLGGRIWYAPVEGGGTIFHFTARFRAVAETGTGPTAVAGGTVIAGDAI
ncbi:MAG: hypothetical protein LBT40_11630 [Deltaproteobacteria bacterium]|nr:hypothetical protein [Deltaproteobacteria bacterium]